MDGWIDGLFNLSFCSFLSVGAAGRVTEILLRLNKHKITQTSFNFFYFPITTSPFVCQIVHDVCVFLLIFKWTCFCLCIVFVSRQQQDGDGEDG